MCGSDGLSLSSSLLICGKSCRCQAENPLNALPSFTRPALMLEIAVELTENKPIYADMCQKFLEHFLRIANALLRSGQGEGMWDEEDGFFYDVLRLPDG